ncbi:MAG: hypothetical protein RL660_2102 [Bacteroidota bacterium]|jgi:serine/threonine-protein kinase HipA
MKNYKKTYSREYVQALFENKEGLMVEEPPMQLVVPSNKCLFCYERLQQGAYFHEACNKRFFAEKETPLLDFRLQDLKLLAQHILQSQQAVAGVQAKISLSKTKQGGDSSKKLTIVGMHGHYILKPPSHYYPELPEVEDVTMHLAQACGLDVVPHTLVYLSDGTRCYLTKRVDRLTKNRMLHMEDLCQLSGRLTEDKYKGSHEQACKVLMQYSATPLVDASNYWDLVLFCFLTGNADMHLKNFSLLENTALGGYTLSPAYDLLNTAVVNPADKEELALTLNGKKSKLKQSDFRAAYLRSGLTEKAFDKMLESLYYCLPAMLSKLEDSFLSNAMKEAYQKVLVQRYQQLYA